MTPLLQARWLYGSGALFQVWASLLANWSPVFKRMINSDNYVEAQSMQVVITDFSAAAVEALLRFLYSGTLQEPLNMVVEVVAIS